MFSCSPRRSGNADFVLTGEPREKSNPHFQVGTASFIIRQGLLRVCLRIVSCNWKQGLAPRDSAKCNLCVETGSRGYGFGVPLVVSGDDPEGTTGIAEGVFRPWLEEGKAGMPSEVLWARCHEAWALC